MIGYTVDDFCRDGSSVERKEFDNARRARQKVYDYARCNNFDWFITLTFDPKKINSFDYNECAKALWEFTHHLHRKGCRWLIVPEQHKSGAYHFHGLVSGKLDVSLAVNPHNGKVLTDGGGNAIYNLEKFPFGHTTATLIRDPSRVATYIAEYMTKDIVVPKGRKRYWASRSLSAPNEELLQMTSEEFGMIFNDSRYQKYISSIWGDCILCET